MRVIIRQIFNTSLKLEGKATGKGIGKAIGKENSRDNPLYSGLQLPKGEHSYHGLNLITNPGAPIARGIGIRSEKPLNGFFQPGSSCPGRTPSTALHGVIYNIDISAATKTASLKEGQ